KMPLYVAASSFPFLFPAEFHFEWRGSEKGEEPSGEKSSARFEIRFNDAESARNASNPGPDWELPEIAFRAQFSSDLAAHCLMANSPPAEVTQLLARWSGGDRRAFDDLMPLVYEELRCMAHRHMANERADHTLQATELVNEVYLKLKDERAGRWKNRSQFFGLASQMMRFILVDYARRNTRAK